MDTDRTEEVHVLLLAMYRTENDETYCDRCSMRFLNTGVALSYVPSGTPCTCEGCGVKARSV